jgi:hypothetical protein
MKILVTLAILSEALPFVLLLTFLLVILSGGCSEPGPQPPITQVQPRVTRFHPTIFEAKARGLIP